MFCSKQQIIVWLGQRPTGKLSTSATWSCLIAPIKYSSIRAPERCRLNPALKKTIFPGSFKAVLASQRIEQVWSSKLSDINLTQPTTDLHKKQHWQIISWLHTSWFEGGCTLIALLLWEGQIQIYRQQISPWLGQTGCIISSKASQDLSVWRGIAWPDLVISGEVGIDIKYSIKQCT